MSVTVSRQPSGQPIRRIREDFKDGLAVLAFSAAASSGLALVLMLAVRLAN